MCQKNARLKRLSAFISRGSITRKILNRPYLRYRGRLHSGYRGCRGRGWRFSAVPRLRSTSLWSIKTGASLSFFVTIDYWDGKGFSVVWFFTWSLCIGNIIGTDMENQVADTHVSWGNLSSCFFFPGQVRGEEGHCEKYVLSCRFPLQSRPEVTSTGMSGL